MNFFLHDMPQPQPVLAILTMDDQTRPFRGNHVNFIDLIRTGREMGVFVVVATVRDIKLANRRINCYLYHPETKTWSQRLLPLPRVFYNRIPSRKDELQPEVQQTIRSLLRHPQTNLFNPYFFNKVSLFEWITKAKETRKFVPATKKLDSLKDLQTALRNHDTIYLKPARGKAGSGIMRIEKTNTGGKPSFRISMQNDNRALVTQQGTLSGLWEQLKETIKTEDYILQQGIALASHQNRPFDLRVLMQKNGQGNWTLTGIGARVAGKRSITTHVPRGGSIDEPGRLLAASFGKDQAAVLLRRVKRAAGRIAKQIEKASGHPLGEMSMDLGIDTAGHIWFFEANSRPMKFDEPDIRQRSLEHIIQYALYLSRQRKP
ncbi:endospore coat-associated protein YheD [Paenibacillus sp. J31TS4]|uniref:YheC/YheD family endospore coat-associated protein n=1 Tax=Paenibacillus sp. J31TS4 TaxID=2807195 RepID=UPI001B0F485A|nr:YheC/YheD family protein [Paenibacillus sp. J31TS4]GIP38266.1 endospore coat-associated protein YheD [Paenibacillus sp. J31TS4]